MSLDDYNFGVETSESSPIALKQPSIVWKTSDGKEFVDHKEADNHEAILWLSDVLESSGQLYSSYAKNKVIAVLMANCYIIPRQEQAVDERDWNKFFFANLTPAGHIDIDV